MVRCSVHPLLVLDSRYLRVVVVPASLGKLVTHSALERSDGGVRKQSKVLGKSIDWWCFGPKFRPMCLL